MSNRIIAALLAPFAWYLVAGFVAADLNALNWGLDGRAFYVLVTLVIVAVILTAPARRD
ncbi:hypothetical protein [Pontibaca methylaminivorans]|uniref:Uncharacterized protein n=1 Tax=Pontibaca methylaminivorans TaxID=515897 RepID=A0A1R3W943_9RHOB|nr:hypothetical protein [Pontibaca methylaminivorans]SIT74543.1 hypothetical protein SAMN05421849_0175 [Pontibaca methylaminivorans]